MASNAKDAEKDRGISNLQAQLEYSSRSFLEFQDLVPWSKKARIECNKKSE